MLVAVQLGLYFGASRMITSHIDHANADLWITTYGAKSYEDGGLLLSTHERHQALATPGVDAVIPLVVSFAEWRKPSGGSTRVVVVGTNPEDGGLAPWALSEGTWQNIEAPEGIAVDRSYLQELGISGVGDTAQIATGRVRVRALTDGVRSFTQSPYVYTPLSRARSLIGADGDKTTFFLVQLAPGADRETVRQELQNRLEGAEVLTKRSSATAACASGCSGPAPALRSSAARCSASSSARSSSRRRSTRARRTTSTSSPRCARSARPPATSTA